MPERSYWIVVGSPDNVQRTRELGFTVQGFKSRHRKKAEQMRPGDLLAYYVTGIKGFAAIAEITSTAYEDHDPIWHSSNKKRADEDYPWRVRIEPVLTLPDGVFLPAEEIAHAMTYVQKWPAENWTLAFQGNLHRVDKADFGLIRAGLLEAAATPA